MADRMGLDSTMLHYLAVRKAMVSVHKFVHSKITLTYSLTWQADHFSVLEAIESWAGPENEAIHEVPHKIKS